jgi:uncharacterized protein YjbJ (UPF0337 family)
MPEHTLHATGRGGARSSGTHQASRDLRARVLDSEGEFAMNWDTVSGNWKQAVGKMKEQWGKLTDDDLTQAEGKRDALVGRIQERYGIAKDEAERRVADFERSYRI